MTHSPDSMLLGSARLEAVRVRRRDQQVSAGQAVSAAMKACSYSVVLLGASLLAGGVLRGWPAVLGVAALTLGVVLLVAAELMRASNPRRTAPPELGARRGR